jgi:hypothetical protein
MSVFRTVAFAFTSLALAGCGKKLAAEDCDHLLGRAVGLAAYEGAEPFQKEMGIYGGVPVDLALLRKSARGKAKQAIEDFDRACVGADDGGAIACGRRAKSDEEFRACGGMVTKARETATVARVAVTRKHSVDQCARYADHAVKIGAASPDDASALVRSCEDWLEIGFFECRVAAKDKAAWEACDAP